MNRPTYTALSLLTTTFSLTVAPSQTPPGGSAKGRAPSSATESVRPSASHKIALAISNLLGWHAGFPSTKEVTFLDAAVKTDAAGLGYIEGFSTQKAGPQIAGNLDSSLSAEEQNAVKAKLRALNVSLYAYHLASIRPDSRNALEFAKAMGAHIVVGPADLALLPAIDKLAQDVGIDVAIEAGKNAKAVLAALQASSPHLGIAGDARIAAGAKDRLMALELSNGDIANAQMFLEIAKQEPPPEEHPDQCGNCGRPHGGTKPLFIALESGTASQIDALEKAVRPAMGYRVDEISKMIPITGTDKIPADERRRLEAAIPTQTQLKPAKVRKLLIVDLCPAGGYYHKTIAHANLALQLMAKTGAFEPIFSNDLNNLKYPKIKEYDAIFLNSVVGEVFPDPDVLNGLIRFVHEGGGVAGIHGSTYASMDLPEYSELMGAADGPHHVEAATLKIDDPNNPIVKQFDGKEIAHTDEFYHFQPTGPFSRQKLHVLMSLDTAKSDMSQWHVRPDNDYGLVWIKSYGKGRVFNCAMGHTPLFYENAGFEQMILNGIQFVLGDLAADTTPSAKLAANR